MTARPHVSIVKQQNGDTGTGATAGGIRGKVRELSQERDDAIHMD